MKELLNVSEVINETIFSIDYVLQLNVVLAALLSLLFLVLTLGNVLEQVVFLLFFVSSNLVVTEVKAGSLSVDRNNSFRIVRVRLLELCVILLLVDRSKDRGLVPVVFHNTGDDNKGQ